MFFVTNEIEEKAINQLLEELDIPIKEDHYTRRADYQAKTRHFVDDTSFPEVSNEVSFDRLINNLDNFDCPRSFYASV